MTEVTDSLRRAYETYRQWCVDSGAGEHFEWSAGPGRLRLPDGTVVGAKDGDLVQGMMKNDTFHVLSVVEAEHIN